jgi:methyl-accepting chemotaxis protein-2 (aspartate sensor receptor)
MMIAILVTSILGLNQARTLPEEAAKKARQGCEVSRAVVETMRSVQNSTHHLS